MPQSNNLFWTRSVLCLLWILTVEAGGQKPALRFRDDGTFKIVQFTDLHYGEQPPERDVNSSRVQSVILQAEDPDIVVMTGDCASGYAWDGSHGWFEERWNQLIQPMIKFNVPWATALGNHDDEADLNREEIVALDRSNPLSRTELGPANVTGATNYVLSVVSSQASDTPSAEDIIANLWMFDSGDNNCLGVSGWDCIYPDQVQWYRRTSIQMQQSTGRVVPGLSFFHIPTPEFMNVWNYEKTFGRLEDDGVCCFSLNTGLYAAAKEQGDIISMHCGHDHNNDFYGDYYNVTLAYGRKTGYGGYGPPPGWLRGARVIELQENPFSMTMWIRQEDGSRVDVQPLHPPGANQTHLCCDAMGAESSCSRYARLYRERMAPVNHGKGKEEF